MDMEMERVVDDGANAVDDAGRAQGHAGPRGIHLVSVRIRHDKCELLATQHARYALLVRTVDRWRSVAAARCARREQLIAACRVGARFFQRLYWNQWKETLTRRREARERACVKLQSAQSKIRLLRGFHRWKHVVEARRQTVSNAQSASDERRLQVQGMRIKRNDESGQRATCSTDSDPSVRRQAKIARIRVYYTQRQYFQRWLEMVKNWSNACKQRFKAQSRAFQLHTAVRRWRRRTEGRIRGRTMAKQAYFFLYFHLTSSALGRLRRNALMERRERDVVVTIETRVRHRWLKAAFAVWRQRMDMKLVFFTWREFVATQHAQASDVARMGQLATTLWRDRLLRKSYVAWRSLFNVRRRHQTLATAIRTLNRRVLGDTFRTWHLHTSRLSGADNMLRARRLRTLTQVLATWKTLTLEKSRCEQQRRAATRFRYFWLLRRGFQAFASGVRRRDHIETLIQDMETHREQRLIREAFVQWRMWAHKQRSNSHRIVIAEQVHKKKIKKRAFSVLAVYTNHRKQRTALLQAMRESFHHRLLLAAFVAWKSVVNDIGRRQEQLEDLLAHRLQQQSSSIKRQVFDGWDDYTRSRLTKRLMNAQLRGRHQTKTLRRLFAAWLSVTADLKWQDILKRRAQQHYALVLKRKAFARWKAKVEDRRKEREQTRQALIHWKLTRERQAFVAWKTYIGEKQCQRQRMHAALEFRHQSFLRDGLRHWLTAATYLQQERERQVTQSQASHTKRVWRRVAQIAMHWKWLTAERQQRRQHNPRPTERGHATLRVFNSAADETSRTSIGISRGRPTFTYLPDSRRTHETSVASGLSEFVMLPRTRPRPRKPVELIVNAEGLIEDTESVAEYNPFESLQGLNQHYGFQFPVRPQALSPAYQVRWSSLHHTPSAMSVFESDKDATVSILELEERLRGFEQRRQRWKRLQQSLEEFRRNLYDASTQGLLSSQELGHMKQRLALMEEQNTQYQKQWLASKPEIKSLAAQLSRLRRAVMA